MKTQTAQNLSLEIKRLIKAPRDRVFAAWTTPQDIQKWFGPGPCRVLSAKVDLRPGGEYRIQAEGGECGNCEVVGVYREIKRPSRLVYTWQWQGSEMGETLVTVDFAEVDGWTEVRLRHEGFPAAEPRDKHNQGWDGCLDKLEKMFSTRAELSPKG